MEHATLKAHPLEPAVDKKGKEKKETEIR